jgi:hypothetical protein
MATITCRKAKEIEIIEQVASKLPVREPKIDDHVISKSYIRIIEN